MTSVIAELVFETDNHTVKEAQLDRVPSVGEVITFPALDDKQRIVRSIESKLTKGPSGIIYGLKNVTIYLRRINQNTVSNEINNLNGEEIVWLQRALTNLNLSNQVDDRMRKAIMNKLIG